MRHSEEPMGKAMASVRDGLIQSQDFYRTIHLSEDRDCLLKAFVDIVHNDHSLNRFLEVSVSLPSILNDIASRFYLYDKSNDTFLCVCDSETGLVEPPKPADFSLHAPFRTLQEHHGWLIYPLYPRSGSARKEPLNRQQEHGPYDPDPYYASHSLLGLYAVSLENTISSEDRQFLAIACRWIGNKLNNRLLAKRHMEHLQFLNSLSRDIGHNVIVPNMYLKYLLRQVEKQIASLKKLEKGSVSLSAGDGREDSAQCKALKINCKKNRATLEHTSQELARHHNQITLFLESLFREQHFSKGRFVLQASLCFVERDIIQPQLALYMDKFHRQGITVEKPSNLNRRQFSLMVDVGLLSQVYMNLFSNGVKYTETITDRHGRPRKVLTYGVLEIQDFPVPGQSGVKFNVFTTGKPLSHEECLQIFEEGGRLANSEGVPGSGHGLNFIQRVIKVHGGTVGCEPTEEGNNFYFILPLTPDPEEGEGELNDTVEP